MSLLLRSLAAAVGWTEIARGGSVVLETAVSTIIIIFVAEFLPKSVFRNSPNFITACLLLRSISFICCFSDRQADDLDFPGDFVADGA